MSIILYVYFAIVILLFNTNTICDQTSDADYEEDSLQINLKEPLNYLENRVDLNNDNMEAPSDYNDHKPSENSGSEDSGIIEKLKGVWNKILHPNKYDSATYSNTLSSFHDEIFNYLNEGKVARSLQPVNLQCHTTCNSTVPGSAIAPKTNSTASKTNSTAPCSEPAAVPLPEPVAGTASGSCSGSGSGPGLEPGSGLSSEPDSGSGSAPAPVSPPCTTYLKNFTVPQLNCLKLFLKCMQIQQAADKKNSSAEQNKPITKPGCSSSKCGETTTTKKPATTKATKGKGKPKPESGTHSHNLTGNHLALDDSDQALFYNYNLYLNKLKFLAHLHHTVCQVGKKKLEPIDLNLIQKLIDEAKNNLQMANESLNTCKRKDDPTMAGELPNPMFPFLNPYITRKKRNFVNSDNSDDSQINDVVSNVVSKLKESDKYGISENNEYSKILGVRKTKKKKKKKKRGRKKKGKQYRENEEGAETAGKMPMNVNISNSLNNFNADYKTLKFKVSPEQEEDINKFLKNINEPPQLFNFDIEQYLNPNLIERNHDPPKIKSFYEFDDAEHLPQKRKPGQFYVFNQGEVDEPTPYFKPKRDLLTQRIKAISNKMKMDSFLAQSAEPREFLQDTSKVSRSSDSYASPLNSPSLNLDQSKSDTDFIDKFYLLNDGNPNTMSYKTDNHNELDKINPIDLGIDLDLDKKFRDLKWETDRRFYKDVQPDTEKDKKAAQEQKNDEDIGNDDFVFYK